MLLRFGAALGVADVRPGVSLAAAAPTAGEIGLAVAIAIYINKNIIIGETEDFLYYT